MEFLSKENSQYYHWLPIFTVMLGTGMRVGEITGLRWNDIDLKSGIIDVNHTLVYYKHRDENGCYFDIHSPKTKAGVRQIPMTEEVKNAFLLEKKMHWVLLVTSSSDGSCDAAFKASHATSLV